jgi:hypothetical protein
MVGRHWGVVLGLALTATASVPAAAAAQQWEQLGSRRVRFTAERDVIDVGRVEGLFNAIRIDVDAGDIEMFDVRVVFADGSDFSPNTRIEFREGSRSRVIDLPGAARAIRRVSFSYRSRLRRGQAVVRLLGRHAVAGGLARAAEGVAAAAAAPGAPAVEGWTHLGSRTVEFRADRDVISAVGDGAFRQVRFQVDKGDLEMFDVRIVFANGERYSPPTRLVFGENSHSRVIDLPGTVRVIRRIEFRYRSIAGGGEGRAVVHAYGR